MVFEDEGEKDRARTRLLRAAKKHGIMPIGFVSAQLNPREARTAAELHWDIKDVLDAHNSRSENLRKVLVEARHAT